ncbi:MAG: AsmA-like C-terminal domain-containing protein [Alphaproteobacteria bacterium]|nr:AsmA-like C-terminal domain-containing protein [Alphaproteobacteria bacterium]
MKYGFIHISARALFLMMEALGLLILVLFVGAGFILWRIGQGPVDLNFAKPYIQQAFSEADERYHIQLDRVFLSRDQNKGPVTLSIDDLTLIRRDTQTPVLNINEVDVSFSYLHLFLGKIRPISVIFQSPSILLVKTEQGIEFALRNSEAKSPVTVSSAPARALPEQIALLVSWLEDSSQRIGLLKTLKTFEIRNAGVLLRDMTQRVSWYITDFDVMLRDTPEAVSAYMSVSMSQKEKAKADMRVYLTYRRDQKDFAFSANIDQFNPIILTKFFPQSFSLGATEMTVTGQIGAVLDQNMALQSASVNVTVPEGTIDYPQEFTQPLPLKDVALQTTFTSLNKTLTLEKFKATIADIPVEGTGKLMITPEGLSAPIVFKTVGDITPEKIAPVFPNSERDGEAAKWVLELMTGGVYRDVVFSSDLLLTRQKRDNAPDEWVFGSDNTKLAFAFEGVDVLYHDTLTPAKNCQGSGVLDVTADKLTIEGSADIGDIQGQNAKLEFTDIMVRGGGNAIITFDAQGSLASAFEYISLRPISMGDQLGVDGKNAKGNIEMSARLEFPTIKDAPREAFKVNAKATLTNVTLPGVVETMTLTGGPLTLDVQDGSFRVAGSGQLDGRDITLDWHEFFDPAGHPYLSKVTASVSADQAMRHKFGVMLDDYFSGSLPADITYTTFADKKSELFLTGNLKPLSLHIRPFQYQKPEEVEGTVTLKAFLDKGVLKSIDDLSIKAPDFIIDRADLTFAPMRGKSAELSGGTLPSVIIGRTQVKADFTVNEKNLLKLSANGVVFDAAPFMKGNPAEKTDSATPNTQTPLTMNISLAVDKMLTGEDLSVGATKLYIETDIDGDMTRLEMDSVAGAGDIYLRFKPDQTGKRTFRLEADDAGATLLAFDLYDQVRGGTILVYGEPQGQEVRGDIWGTARMENFTIVKAPALAKLLSIMSLSGLGETLNNQGLSFAKLETQFEWQFRPEGNLLIVKDGRTSGSSIGLTFDGVFDRGANTTDLRGTIIPMTEINSFLKNIPIVGDILTGGNGLIAATYTMKGPSKEPNVMVNPLSILTPGFLRTILFEGGFKNPPPADQ